MQRQALAKPSRRIRPKTPERLKGVCGGRRLAEQLGIDAEQELGALVGGPADHDAIDLGEVGFGIGDRADAAVDRDRERGEGRLQPINPAILERGDVAVFAGREALKPGFSGMHDESVGAGRDGRARQGLERFGGILVVDADPTLDRDRHGNCGLHGRDARADERRLAHQAGSEPALLDAVRRAADVEVDLVVAELRADARRLGAGGRV